MIYFFILQLVIKGYAVTYPEVEPIVQNKCAVCHRGPFLDLTIFPFIWSNSKDQKVIVDELIRRMSLPEKGKMPPVNGKPLTAEEFQLIKIWRDDGLQP